MSGTRPDGGSAPDSAPRPLPARPNLEFERKRAKKLLREMRRSDANAKLADAQFAIARGYGFSSWPKLVQYYGTLDVHKNSSAPPAWYPLDHFERSTQTILARHANGRFGVALALIAFIPRFYGKTVDDVLGSTVTIDDARLVVARENRLPGWEALVEWISANAKHHTQGWEQHESPIMLALRAMRAGDIDALGLVVDKHPDLLLIRPRNYGGPGSALQSALRLEFEEATPRCREIVDYLVSRGANLQDTANWMLLLRIGYGHHRDESSEAKRFVRFLLDRGADLRWTPPNGYTVLEHMLVREHASRHISLILEHVAPPEKFWVAAALGDVARLHRYYDRNGKLTAAARKHRPDFTALGPFSAPYLPDASDIQIMSEAFVVALINDQYASMEFLIEHGFPVDYPTFGWTAMWNAVNSCNVGLAEFLLKHGAKPDLKGATTPEERDQWLLEADPNDANARRIYELCGGDNADGVIERYRARQETPPEHDERFTDAIDRAREEAARLEQSEVTDHNLFVGLLRDKERMFAGILGYYGIRLPELKTELEARLVDGDPQPSREVPMGPDAQASIDAAIARRQKMHWRQVSSRDLLWALARKDSGPVIELLVRHGADMAKMRESLESM